jgi:hypothetical protein
MKSAENIEAELLLEVQQTAAAFEDACHRYGKRQSRPWPEGLAPFERDFQDALQAFSNWILDGCYTMSPDLRVT